jgi:hypothetical protein
MRGLSSDCIVQTNPLTLALSPRFVVSVLRDSLAGERGQNGHFSAHHISNRVKQKGGILTNSATTEVCFPILVSLSRLLTASDDFRWRTNGDRVVRNRRQDQRVRSDDTVFSHAGGDRGVFADP